MPTNSNGKGAGREWSIADGLFAMEVPSDWDYEPEAYDRGAFRLPRGGRLEARVTCYDDRACVDEGRLADYAVDPEFHIPQGYSNAEVTEKLLLMIRRGSPRNPPRKIIAKSMNVLEGRHIRVARFSLPLAEDEARDAELVARLAAKIAGAVHPGRFADHLVPMDLMAATEELKMISPWKRIYLRVPTHWRVEETEDGRFVCDVTHEQTPPDPTLWIDYDLCQRASDAPGAKAAELTEAYLHKYTQGLGSVRDNLGPPVVERTDEGIWIKSMRSGSEDGEALRFFPFIASSSGTRAPSSPISVW